MRQLLFGLRLPRGRCRWQVGDSPQHFDFQFAAFWDIHRRLMPITFGGATLSLSGEMVFTNRHEFTGTKWYNFVGGRRIVMRQRSECHLIVFLNILLSVLNDLWSLRNQNSIFRVKSSYPGCVMAVPSIVIRG